MLLLLCLPALLLGAEKDVLSGVERIVAIGDVHGIGRASCRERVYVLV